MSNHCNLSYKHEYCSSVLHTLTWNHLFSACLPGNVECRNKDSSRPSTKTGRRIRWPAFLLRCLHSRSFSHQFLCQIVTSLADLILRYYVVYFYHISDVCLLPTSYVRNLICGGYFTCHALHCLIV